MNQFQRQEHSRIRPAASHESEGVSLASRSSVSLQPELELTQPGDMYEQEAERMADRITDNAFAAGSPTPNISRSSISRTPSGYASVSVPPSLESAISSSRGSGFSMPPALKARMESGFGADFSDVRLHTDSTAARMSSSIRANAFTSGNDIYFASGKYDPSSRMGRHLIAHELTHTLQQSGKVARDPSGDTSTKVDLPVPERNSTRRQRLEADAVRKENRCRRYLWYILMHDPAIVEKGLTDKDAKTVSRLFSESIIHRRNFQTSAWTLEHILDEQEAFKSIDTDWLTDYLADKYSIFKDDYENALVRALGILAERLLVERYVKVFNPRAAAIKNETLRGTISYSLRGRIYGWLLDESRKEYAPEPYRRYLASQFAAFGGPVLANQMSFEAVQKKYDDEKKAEEAARKEAQDKEKLEKNREYDAFYNYLILRFFPSGDEVYDNLGEVVTQKKLRKAFGYQDDGSVDEEDRDTKKILKQWENIMAAKARKRVDDPRSSTQMASAYREVWREEVLESGDKFMGFERFVEYEKGLLDYLEDKTKNWAEYFAVPDFLISAETHTKVFFTIMKTVLAFFPVGAFEGMSAFAAKASEFFVTKVMPKLVDVAVNESYDKDGTNKADVNLIISALSLGVDSFFSVLPSVCESTVGKIIEGSTMSALQSIASDSSEYLVRYVYGDDLGDWAMVTTKNAMKAFATSLGSSTFKEIQKKAAYRERIKGVNDMANKAKTDLDEGKITQVDFNKQMDECEQLRNAITKDNDDIFAFESLGAGVIDDTFQLSDKLMDSIVTSDKPAETAPVMVVPADELDLDAI